MIFALVVNSIWNVANFRLPVIRALLEQGHQVHVIAPDGPEGEMLKNIGCQVHPLFMDCKGTHLWRDGRLMWQLRQLYADIQPDLILHYTIKPVIYGSLAARSLGIPSLNTITGLGTAFLSNSWVQLLVKQLYRWALSASPVVVFQNPDDKDLFVRARLLRADQATLAPGSGIDVDRFSVQPLPDVSGQYPVFLLVGRMLRDKGVVEFVEAARQVRQLFPGARFALLGFLGVENVSAITQAQMDEWVSQGVVEYWGATSDVRPMVAKADCVVLPSYREGMPRTLLEASAMGRPLVATDVPGCREVVQEGVNGALCQAKDASSLAQAMLRIAQRNPAQRLALGLAARERVENLFAERYVINCYLKAISAMLK
jgi:glycosyltransferase involved in cell wall biosynthesis